MTTPNTTVEAVDVPSNTASAGRTGSRPISRRRQNRSRYIRCGISILMVVIYGAACLYEVHKSARRTIHAIGDHKRAYRMRHSRIPKSTPLAMPRTNSVASYPDQPASFLILPLEIRLRIYELVVPTKLIFQPGGLHPGGTRRLESLHGPRPAYWSPGQCIRSDEDPPSATLQSIIKLGGSYLHQLPWRPSPRRKRYSRTTTLICGDQAIDSRCWTLNPELQRTMVFVTDLMRTCRVAYNEVLDLLYADNTISFFGAESLLFFARQVSPEGLWRIRHVHFALIIPSRDWAAPDHMKLVKKAIDCLRSSFGALSNLDVEVLLTSGQPTDDKRFWKWLRDDVLGHLRATDEFVLKISVSCPYGKESNRREGHSDWTRGYEPFESWNDADYLSLKKIVTEPKRKEAIR